MTTTDRLVPCPSCDGTGEVHSHNPKCWSCRGTGLVTPEKAAKLRAHDKMMRDLVPPRTSDYR